MAFVDTARIQVQAGNGGKGCESHYRDKYMRHPRPDGGDGGRGGHIILRGNAQLWTLLHLRYHKNILAKDGNKGGKNNSSGAYGDDIVIEVPLGTIARNEETGEVEAEILEDGQEIILMKGGRGGWGNQHFATPTNQVPEHAQPGEDGREGWSARHHKGFHHYSSRNGHHQVFLY